MMKTLKIIKRLSVLGSLVAAGLFLAPQAMAASGWCSASNGTMPYSFNFNKTLTDPAQNITGLVIKNAAGNNWNLSTPYLASCECSTMTNAYITAVSGLTQLDHVDDNLNYFVLNDYLAVSSEVYIGGGRGEYIAVPFSNESNRNQVSGSCTNQPYLSGARGRVNIYFRRPFVGQTAIPATKLVDVYMSSTSGVQSPKSVATVSMSGTIIVPQNCDIGPSPVSVNFGDIISSNFKTKNAKPTGFTPINKQLTLSCRNISAGVKINLSFQATPDINEPTALETTNGDIAVKIEDSAGTVIAPKNGRLPVNFDYAAQKGTAQMNIYPINTTGNTPSIGTFRATATIRAEIQ